MPGSKPGEMRGGLRPNKKGERRGGRQRGTPNKQTASVREAIARAFEGLGGVPALITWARANRSEFYCKMLVRLLPAQTQIDGSLHMLGAMPTLEESRERMREVLGMVAPELKDDDGSACTEVAAASK